MQQLSVFLGNFGYRLHIGRKQGKRQENGADVHPKQLQKLLDQIEGTPEEGMLSRLILRSMKRAVYLPECSEHLDWQQHIIAIYVSNQTISRFADSPDYQGRPAGQTYRRTNGALPENSA